MNLDFSCEFLDLLLDIFLRSLLCTPMIFILGILFKEEIYYMNHVFWYSSGLIFHDMISLYLWLVYLEMIEIFYTIMFFPYSFLFTMIKGGKVMIKHDGCNLIN